MMGIEGYEICIRRDKRIAIKESSKEPYHRGTPKNLLGNRQYG
jgi:hypothetical protein